MFIVKLVLLNVGFGSKFIGIVEIFCCSIWLSWYGYRECEVKLLCKGEWIEL